MGVPKYTDTCDWCGCGTNSLQIRASTDVGLCPECCTDVDADEVPDDAPPSWYHMSEEEREDWRNGMGLEEIMDKHDWR